MKALSDLIDRHGGLFFFLCELGLGLFAIISLVKCAAS